MQHEVYLITRFGSRKLAEDCDGETAWDKGITEYHKLALAEDDVAFCWSDRIVMTRTTATPHMVTNGQSDEIRSIAVRYLPQTELRGGALGPDFIDRMYQWSLSTFGEGSNWEGLREHLHEEVDEAVGNPSDAAEWADIVILAFEGASRAGFSGAEILDAIATKYVENRHRTWEKDGNKIKHKKRGEK